MKIIRIITIACLPVALFGVVLASSCKNQNLTDPTPANIVDLIKGKTYRLGNVLNGATNANSKFTGFTISFTAAGNTATLSCNCDATTGGTFSGVIVNARIDGNVNNPGTITFTSTPPNAWPASFSNVSTNAAGTALNFNATLSSSSIVITPGGKTAGTGINYTFNLVQ